MEEFSNSNQRLWLSAQICNPHPGTNPVLCVFVCVVLELNILTTAKTELMHCLTFSKLPKYIKPWCSYICIDYVPPIILTCPLEKKTKGWLLWYDMATPIVDKYHCSELLPYSCPIVFTDVLPPLSKQTTMVVLFGIHYWFWPKLHIHV